MLADASCKSFAVTAGLGTTHCVLCETSEDNLANVTLLSSFTKLMLSVLKGIQRVVVFDKISL